MRGLGPFRRGTVLTVDYLRNVTTNTLLGVDANHVGDVHYFNKSAAQVSAAVSATDVEGFANQNAAGAKSQTVAVYQRSTGRAVPTGTIAF